MDSTEGRKSIASLPHTLLNVRPVMANHVVQSIAADKSHRKTKLFPLFIFLRIFTVLKKYIIVFFNGHLYYKRDKGKYIFFLSLLFPVLLCHIYSSVFFLQSAVQSILLHIQIFLVIYKEQKTR